MYLLEEKQTILRYVVFMSAQYQGVGAGGDVPSPVQK